MKTAKKKAGDGFPLDRVGQMLFDGCIVVLSEPSQGGDPGNNHLNLVVGFIKKLGKSYADVTYQTPVEAVTVRLKSPSTQLLMIDPSQLPLRNAEFEQLKVAAYKSRQ